MYKLIKIYTHGASEIIGTQIFVLADFNTSKDRDSLISMFLYNERGVLTKTHGSNYIVAE